MRRLKESSNEIPIRNEQKNWTRVEFSEKYLEIIKTVYPPCKEDLVVHQPHLNLKSECSLTTLPRSKHLVYLLIFGSLQIKSKINHFI